MISYYLGGNPLKLPKRLLDHGQRTSKSNSWSPMHAGIPIRILVISWNMAGSLPEYCELQKLLSPQRLEHDIIVIGTQECEHSMLFTFFFSHKHGWEKMLKEYLKGEFEPIETQSMVGTHIIIFARFWLAPYIKDPRYKRIYSGFKGFTGAKGAVSLYMHIGYKTFNFINCHLKADHHNIKKRNQGLLRVLRKLADRRDADQVFVFGDLNYRFKQQRDDAHQLISQLDQKSYEDYDQLKLQQNELTKFLHYHFEGPLTFAPTYKLLKNQNRYDQARTPGWTDRIFYKSRTNETQLLDYRADFSVLGSDHRPVIGSFLTMFNHMPIPVIYYPKGQFS